MMMTSVGKPLQIVFLCSPSIGILDSWLPVISELLRYPHEYEIIFFIPRFPILRQLSPSNPLVKFSSPIFSKIICINSFGKLLTFRSLSRAHLYYYIAFFDHLHLFFKRCCRRFGSKYQISIVQRIFQILNRKKEYQLSHNDLFENAILLYDVYEESKVDNSWFFKNYNFRQKFSLFHGIDIHSLPLLGQKAQIDITNLSCFLYSPFEINYYQNTLGVDKSCITVAGIPRHDHKWIQELCKETNSSLFKKKSAVLFSRPISDYLPRHRKVEALEAIKQCLVDDYNFFLYVKKHPKEQNEGIFEAVLGSNLKRITWDYIDVHPYQAAIACELALVFYSNLCVDMTALKIPTIEYLNLRNIAPYSLPDYPHIDDEPVFSYRLHGLVHGVSSKEEFRNAVSSIFADKNAFMGPFIKQYCKYFPREKNVSEYIAARIASISDFTDKPAP